MNLRPPLSYSLLDVEDVSEMLPEAPSIRSVFVRIRDVSEVEGRFRFTIQGRNIQLQVDRQKWSFRRSYFKESRIRQAEPYKVPVASGSRALNNHFSAVLNKMGKHLKALRSLGFPVVTYQVGRFCQGVGCHKDVARCSNQFDQAIVVFSVESGESLVLGYQ